MDFNELPNQAKIFIFQNPSEFSSVEKDFITTEMSDFLQKWQAHGKNLSARFTLVYNKFIVIGVDESLEKASGCSMDALRHKVQELEKKLNIILLDNSQISYQTKGQEIQTTGLLDFKKMLKNQEIKAEDYIFDNSVTTMEDFINSWKVQIKNSWASKFLPEIS